MKKVFVISFASMVFTLGAYAQGLKLFNHLAVGASVGTPGIGVDVAMPATRFFDIQAGISIMPRIKYDTNVHLNNMQYIDQLNQTVNINVPNDIRIQGKLNMLNGKVMINFMPIAISSFHVTVGAYIGGSDIIEVYNTQDGQLDAVNQANAAIDTYNQNLPVGLPKQEHIGLKVGNYLLTPDEAGNAKATLKTNVFKPYVGLGFGRAVPGKKRIGVKFDLGAMFWGTPTVVDHNGTDLTQHDWDGKDGGAFRIISKFKVYPVLNLRICGRIF
jgi:hypothetical protein